MAPIVDGVEQKYSSQLVVKRVNANVDTGPQIMRVYRIPGHPALLLFEVARTVGPQSQSVVEKMVQPLMDKKVQ